MKSTVTNRLQTISTTIQPYVTLRSLLTNFTVLLTNLPHKIKLLFKLWDVNSFYLLRVSGWSDEVPRNYITLRCVAQNADRQQKRGKYDVDNVIWQNLLLKQIIIFIVTCQKFSAPSFIFVNLTRLITLVFCLLTSDSM